MHISPSEILVGSDFMFGFLILVRVYKDPE